MRSLSQYPVTNHDKTIETKYCIKIHHLFTKGNRTLKQPRSHERVSGPRAGRILTFKMLVHIILSRRGITEQHSVLGSSKFPDRWQVHSFTHTAPQTADGLVNCRATPPHPKVVQFGKVNLVAHWQTSACETLEVNCRPIWVFSDQ